MMASLASPCHVCQGEYWTSVDLKNGTFYVCVLVLDQPCSYMGDSRSYMSYICWQVSVLDVVPLAFALDKLLSTPRSETDSSIISMIINVTFSF